MVRKRSPVQFRLWAPKCKKIYFLVKNFMIKILAIESITATKTSRNGEAEGYP
tara:strand:+ start:144 stop:302 length:159 start_codon:yes stop_codon:yes gene_type:complete